MRLTTKGRFAVMAMADLALHGGCGPVTLSSISERQKISQSYLEQLFGKLRKRNIVVAVRGPGGVGRGVDSLGAGDGGHVDGRAEAANVARKSGCAK